MVCGGGCIPEMPLKFGYFHHWTEAEMMRCNFSKNVDKQSDAFLRALAGAVVFFSLS